MNDKKTLPTPENYPVHTLEKLRFGDTDRQGHINNAVFATLCESGRVAFLYDPDNPLLEAGTQFVIAKLTIDFLDELNWPGDVLIGTGVSRVGKSSFGLTQGIFAGERCAAQCESVLVLMDEQTRRSTPLPEQTRNTLTALLVTMS